jgi:dienelactone hydrolase
MLASAGLLASAQAQGAASTEKVLFEVPGAFEARAAVSGVLRVPDSTRERLPAVLIVNSSPGFDGRGAFYAEALGQAGIATLEVDLFQGKGVPASPRHNLPHAFQSLGYLARHPRIDGSRVGIMGFSWGGIVAVLTSSAELTRQYAGGESRFAAHLGLYPICWRHHAVLAGRPGTWKDLKPAVYRKVTGSPVHILAGDRDDYDDPDSCARFVAALPARARRHFSLTVYPGATFAWDSRFSSAVYERAAKKGKGGIVNVAANPETANRSREFAVTYFRKYLAAD